MPCSSITEHATRLAGPALRPMLSPLAGRRLLYVGSDSAHKNVATIIRAMPAIRKRLPGTTLYLTWPRDHSACRHEDGVVGLGYLVGSDLRNCYELASALVMPSTIETVGLPLVEAMAAGVPLLAADRPYAHDVAAAAAVYFDALDSADFIDKCYNLLSDSDIIARGRSCGLARAEALRRSKPYDRFVAILASVDETGKMP